MNLDFNKLKDLGRRYADKARQYAEGLSPMEMKVADATNDDKWGPHGSAMAEITRDSFRHEEYKLILGVIARRLHSEPGNWRRIYKSLLLLEYMAKNGPEKMVTELKSNQKVFSRLRSFEYVNDAGKDQGINVRNRAKELWNLVNDPDLMAMERDKAAKNRNKYGGMDSHGFTNAPASASGNSEYSYKPSMLSGSPKVSSSANGTPPASAQDDPVEATRRRIENLNHHESDAHTAEAVRKKKLSEISVDSNIASTLARNFKSAAGPPPARKVGSASATPPVATAAPAADDLLGDLYSAPPITTALSDDWADFASAGPDTQAPPTAAAEASDPFGDFALSAAPSAVPAPPVATQSDPFGMDDWTAFPEPSSSDQSAPPPPLPTAAADPFGALATGAPATGPTARAALPMDLFAEPIPPPQVSTLGFPPASTAPDLFSPTVHAAQSTANPGQAAGGGKPMGGAFAAVNPGKKVDPFANLF